MALAVELWPSPVLQDKNKIRISCSTFLNRFFLIITDSSAHCKQKEAPAVKAGASKENFVYSRSFTRDNASSSATMVQSGCSCRMEPGTLGVMGPKKASFTA